MSEPADAAQKQPASSLPQPETAVLSPSQAALAYTGYTDEGIDLYQLWQVLWRARKFIALFTFIATLVAVLVTLYALPVTYKSEAVLVPTESQAGGLGGLAASLPIPLNLSVGGKSDLILAFLNSRNLQQRLIEKYNLLPRWRDGIWDARQNKWLINETERSVLLMQALQRGGFKRVYTVEQDKKTNLITIDWEDKDPTFAAEMLKRVIAELSYYLNNEYESDAMRDRQFVEKQLVQAAKELERSERQIPSAELTLGKIQRERLASQTVYTELRKQLELAKISEAKELIRFKVLDQPYLPVNKYKPKRVLIGVLTLVASTMAAIFLAFLVHGVRHARQKRGLK